ncbi:hypothetical protein V2O64_21455 [Verrucomicrobiaceae bacterium 227]
MMIKVSVICTLLAGVNLNAGQDFFELPPIKYSETASQDKMAKLAAQIESGDWIVPPSDGKEFLRAVLEKLEVPLESQVLVFSKTSLQNSLINQRNPRALYFSMDAYVGWVPGGKVEVIVEDETLGPVFYILEPPVGKRLPKVSRVTDSCLQCHATSRTSGVPGMLVRSVVPDQNSHAILSAGTTLVTDATPLKDRWGGWYVSGVADDPHLGNRWIAESPLDDVDFPAKVTELEDLSSLIDTDKYLQGTSDVVALLVLEHQCRTHNLITSAKLNYLRSRYFHQSFGDELALDSPDGMSWKTADSTAREIVEAFLFTGEVELGGEGVEGGEAFAMAFAKGGVVDEKGKSLRDFRLYSRLFKNRCSYMIYSKAFKGLPELVRERVFHHLREALMPDAENHLGSREKKTIVKILEETVPGFKS